MFFEVDGCYGKNGVKAVLILIIWLIIQSNWRGQSVLSLKSTLFSIIIRLAFLSGNSFHSYKTQASYSHYPEYRAAARKKYWFLSIYGVNARPNLLSPPPPALREAQSSERGFTKGRSRVVYISPDKLQQIPPLLHLTSKQIQHRCRVFYRKSLPCHAIWLRRATSMRSIASIIRKRSLRSKR